MNSPPYCIGFSTLEQEIRLNQVPVQGRIPTWLTGTLVRNGPARFEVGEECYNHWFDGLAMLHAFSFQDGYVSYANRFLESQSCLEAGQKSKISRGEFGTDPCRSLFGRVMAIFFPRMTDNAAVSINMLANHYVALTEAPLPIMFDPETLCTIGPFHYNTQLQGQLSTAHPHFDFSCQQSFDYCTHLSHRSMYHLFSTDAESGRVHRLTSVRVDQPAYMHSFGMTRQDDRPATVSPGCSVLTPQTYARPVHLRLGMQVDVSDQAIGLWKHVVPWTAPTRTKPPRYITVSRRGAQHPPAQPIISCLTAASRSYNFLSSYAEISRMGM